MLIFCSSLKRCEAPVSVDKCCFKQSEKRKLVIVEAHGWIRTAFRRADSTSALGYAVFGILDDYPPGQSRIFLHKTFIAENHD